MNDKGFFAHLSHLELQRQHSKRGNSFYLFIYFRSRRRCFAVEFHIRLCAEGEAPWALWQPDWKLLKARAGSVHSAIPSASFFFFFLRAVFDICPQNTPHVYAANRWPLSHSTCCPQTYLSHTAMFALRVQKSCIYQFLTKIFQVFYLKPPTECTLN